ncbi:Tat pathway signal protein [Cereibacter changlensis]|uniref:Tat pathway signal protein n=1 Tax=Cereibacter changlensis TaxID=402884 RepID=A0A4U0Z4Q5_9RHOB|nr:Tat pathway signal protein [Cereibacter changlensis]TKA96483.1 Tat pathway signal protein [Cereibacter changlensis]
MAFLSRRSLIATGLSFATAGGVGYVLWPRMDGVREEVDRQRRLLSADPGLEELVRMATLAPNGHNTQPWRFQLGERTVAILPDVSRRTPVVDPDDHHLFVSLGCATENLVIAAAALGRGSEVRIGAGAEPAIEIALAPARPGRQELYRAIPLRQSTRSLYDGQPVSTGDLALLEAAAREDGVSVRLLPGRAERDALLDFVIAGNSAQMDDPAFVEELTGWIRFSPASALETGDGLFAPCSGSPPLPDWLGHRLFPRVFRKAAENDKYRGQIRSSAGLAVFVAEQADPAHWIRVGKSFERFALQAAVLGIRTAHVNQPVEVPALRTEFARWLGMPGARPDLVVRFGRAPAMPMSLRRPVSAVLA